MLLHGTRALVVGATGGLGPALVEAFLAEYTRPGDLVFDPFAGFGTTLLVAEATVSYLGLGFAEPRASWGTLLREAGDARVMTEAPWMVAPAVAMFVVVLGIQLVGSRRASQSALLMSGVDRGRA